MSLKGSKTSRPILIHIRLRVLDGRATTIEVGGSVVLVLDGSPDAVAVTSRPRPPAWRVRRSRPWLPMIACATVPRCPQRGVVALLSTRPSPDHRNSACMVALSNESNSNPHMRAKTPPPAATNQDHACPMLSLQCWPPGLLASFRKTCQVLQGARLQSKRIPSLASIRCTVTFVPAPAAASAPRGPPPPRWSPSMMPKVGTPAARRPAATRPSARPWLEPAMRPVLGSYPHAAARSRYRRSPTARRLSADRLVQTRCSADRGSKGSSKCQRCRPAASENPSQRRGYCAHVTARPKSGRYWRSWLHWQPPG
jgi:hypothetical protein